ncbi:hypothetical protein B0I33_106308 [Prauserella shujinwangii]|uniref:Uncharacterized protein n=1 Tax=Prauserella shujinwangii TaxID=1453103 RepID=A0A2T0LTZ1_9PSEU|nr:hypothetical protein [Prauserella shujinwangii]PRX47207.1 hypothetical protein B0I33_106308 [Prauserella shujinwangii]
MNAGELGVRSVRSLTDRMLTVTRHNDLGVLAGLLGGLVGRRAPQRHLFEPVLFELVAIIVHALRRRADPAATGSQDAMYAVDVLDEADAAVAIDEVQPALRAVLRAVLAALNDDLADARFQVGLVTADPDPLARLDAVFHALLWADGLAGERT